MNKRFGVIGVGTWGQNHTYVYSHHPGAQLAAVCDLNAERAQAIAAWYVERKERDGWDADQLMPMLVALDELVPWLKQWHNDLDPTYGMLMGDYFEGFLLEELRSLERPRSELTALAASGRPPGPPAALSGHRFLAGT